MARFRQNKASSGVFMLEMIIVILFFAIASVICVGLFVEARLLSSQSALLSNATNLCRNAAECVRSVGDDPAALTELLSGAPVGEDYVVCYNSNMEAVAEDAPDARYRLVIDFDRQQEMLFADITLSGQDAPLYTLQTAHYKP